MKMYRKVGILSVIIALTININAQTPIWVQDTLSLIETIETGYTMYNNLQATYNVIKNQIAQTKLMIEQAKEIDWDLSDPLGAFRTIVQYGNRLVTYQENLESTIKSKTMKWGDKSFSWEDLYKHGFVGPEGILTDAFPEPFTTVYTPEKTAAFLSRYGMTPAHAEKLGLLRGDMAQKGMELRVTAEKTLGELKNDAEALAAIQTTGKEAKGQVSLAQTQNATLLFLAQKFHEFTLLYARQVSMDQAEMAAALAEEEAEAAMRAKSFQRSHGESFLKLLAQDQETYK